MPLPDAHVFHFHEVLTSSEEYEFELPEECNDGDEDEYGYNQYETQVTVDTKNNKLIICVLDEESKAVIRQEYILNLQSSLNLINVKPSPFMCQKIDFGKYCKSKWAAKTYQWIMENDIEYFVWMLKEVPRVSKQIPDEIKSRFIKIESPVMGLSNVESITQAILSGRVKCL